MDDPFIVYCVAMAFLTAIGLAGFYSINHSNDDTKELLQQLIDKLGEDTPDKEFAAEIKRGAREG